MSYHYKLTLEKPLAEHYKSGSFVINRISNNPKLNNRIVSIESEKFIPKKSLEEEMARKSGVVNNIYNYAGNHTHKPTNVSCKPNIQSELDLRIPNKGGMPFFYTNIN